MRALVLTLALLLSPVAAATPSVEPYAPLDRYACEGTQEGSSTPPSMYESWSWYNTTLTCRYESGPGVRVVDGEDEIAAAWVGHDERGREVERWDWHSRNVNTACGETCWESWGYSNHSESYEGTDSLVGVRSDETRADVEWCDTTAQRHERTESHGVSESGWIREREQHAWVHEESTQRCGLGLRAAGVAIAAQDCTHARQVDYDYWEAYDEANGFRTGGDGTSSWHSTCFYGVSQDEVGVGYEEARHECHPACGPAREQAVVVRAGGVDERVGVDAPFQVGTR